MDQQDAVKQYAHAWGLVGEDSIRAALVECWAEDGSYVDPTTDPVVGADGLARHIAGFQEQFPGASLAPTSGLDGHHLVGRFSWVMSSPSPIVVDEVPLGHSIPGQDFVEFGEDGKIRRIVGFFG
ncbi:nuclear transport factor 2 family protein [Umezawaea sp. NPDC059074]|uniref:nuclear transport factor 2 family protein n=1 Tax=Umezawaea sp. NPDC059074 TaxID=3346716 RepID=UPI0036B1692B